jgi:hypothetical protein
MFINIEDLEKRKEHAHHYADFFKEQNPRFKREMFLAACGLEECDYNMSAQPATIIVGETNGCPVCNEDPCMCDREREMGEGNEFTKARLDAIAQGADTFTVGGKTYNVSGDTSDEKTQVESVNEDININVTANGEEDVVNLIRKLSGLEAIKTVTDKISAMSGEACGACGSAPCGCESLAEEGPKERDIEYTNTPREEVAGTDAAIPAGADLNRAKRQYKKEYPGDNPMAVAEAKEESLWSAYETMINDVKA